MSCEVLSEKRLALLRESRLPDDEKALVVRHLDESCPACEATLGEMDPSLFLETLGGAEAELTPAERARVMPRKEPARRWLRAAWALIPAALAAGVLLLAREPQVHDAGGMKGASAVRWEAWVGERGADGPKLVRPFSSGERVPPGGLVVLRFALARPAFVQVLAQAGTAPVEGLWGTSEGGRPLELGEQSLLSEGQVQAVDPARFARPTRVAIVASPQPVALSGRLGELSQDGVARLCPECSVDVLEVQP